jgi:hypothetical protein
MPTRDLAHLVLRKLSRLADAIICIVRTAELIFVGRACDYAQVVEHTDVSMEHNTATQCLECLAKMVPGHPKPVIQY